MQIFKSLLDTKKPLFLDESSIVNSLSNQEIPNLNNKGLNNKLNSIKPNENNSKVSGTKLINVDSQNNGVKNTLKTLKRLESICEEPSKIDKNESIKKENDQQIKKSIDLKNGLSINQINSQNKLNALIGIKKQSINQDEMNNAFAKINSRKVGLLTNNKLSESINFSSNVEESK